MSPVGGVPPAGLPRQQLGGGAAQPGEPQQPGSGQLGGGAAQPGEPQQTGSGQLGGGAAQPGEPQQTGSGQLGGGAAQPGEPQQTGSGQLGGGAAQPGEPQQPGSNTEQQPAAAAAVEPQDSTTNTDINSTSTAPVQQTAATQQEQPGDVAAAGADQLDQGGGGDGSVVAGQPQTGPRRSGRQTQAPDRLTATKLGTVSVVLKSQAGVIASSLPFIEPDWPGGDEPTYQQVLGRKDEKWWREAMETEMGQLQGLSVFEPADLPLNATSLGVRWVFKLKRDDKGKAVLYKARLVVEGYQQVEGRDYFETFAPTGRLASLRTLLAITAVYDLELEQLDVTTAFLYGELENGGPDIYIDQPPGYGLGWPSAKLRLRKALYGLRQAPRAWYEKLKEALGKCGFMESDADPGVFIFRSEAGIIYIIVHVDDMLLAGPNKALLATFKIQFKSQFKIKDLGDARHYLGMVIERDRAAGTLRLHQTQYARDLVEKYGMELSAPVSTPMAEGVHLMRASSTSVVQRPLSAAESDEYRSLTGSLMYLANCTRPDIALVTGCLARQMSEPTDQHLLAAKRVVRYLRGTAELGLEYSGKNLLLSGDCQFGDFLVGYADADFAGDLTTRRSTTAFGYWLANALVAWQSKLQPTVAASTTEAEYMAAAYAAREALWLRKLLSDFGILGRTATVLYGDNQGAQALARNAMHSQQSKHIDVLYHFVRERVAMGELELRYVPTVEMLADIHPN